MKDMIESGSLRLNAAGRSEEKVIDSSLPEKAFSQIYLRKLGSLDPSLRACLPEFLIISPPQTGTTWLFENLQQHPQIFMPENKELQYFTFYWRRYDINWYLKHFQTGKFYATFFQAPYAAHLKPILHQPGDITTYYDANQPISLFL